MRGRFITFEGGEGSGKTTQSKMLYEHLLAQGVDCIWTREIGGTKAAEQIRDIIVGAELFDTTELLLIMAARYEHVKRVIKPALDRGVEVICDRFIDSTMSYQDPELAWKLHQDIFGDFMPNKTFFIDLEPEIALNRAIARGDGNKFEDKELEFHKKVYCAFKSSAARFSERITVISGMGSEQEIHSTVLAAL